MPEPRRWTLGPYEADYANGPSLCEGERVEVIEAAPVEVELRRLYDELGQTENERLRLEHDSRAEIVRLKGLLRDAIDLADKWVMANDYSTPADERELERLTRGLVGDRQDQDRAAA